MSGMTRKVKDSVIDIQYFISYSPFWGINKRG